MSLIHSPQLAPPTPSTIWSCSSALHGTCRPGPRNGSLAITLRQSSGPRHDRHAALDSCDCGAIRFAGRDSTRTWSNSVGALHATATLWMGRRIPGNLESSWPDCGRARGRPSHMDFCFGYSPDPLKGQARAESLFLDGAWAVQIDTQSDVRRGTGAMAWLGDFFGGLLVLIGFVVLWCVVTLIILPREERSLEAAFGQTYLQYKSRVPRWFRKTK
jgi:hypothetical protein